MKKKLQRMITLLLMMTVMLTLLQTEAYAADTTIHCYTINTGNTRVYSSSDLSKGSGWIYDTDQVTVIEIGDSWCYVKYPISGGSKKGYIPTSAILKATTGKTYTATKKYTTYKRPGGAEYGYIAKGDKVVKLGTKNGYTQVKYPVSSGYKYAWVKGSFPSESKNIVVDGVTLDYKLGDYFTDNGKACTCHEKHSGAYTTDESNCNCKCTAVINGKTVKLGGIQCLGFARYVQSKLHNGNNEYNSKKYSKVSGSTVAASNMTASKVKSLITTAGVGAHLRTGGSAHSMIVTKVTSSGFTVIQANGSNNSNYSGYYNCRIGTSTYTWSSYVSSSYGKRGIAFIKVYKG